MLDDGYNDVHITDELGSMETKQMLRSAFVIAFLLLGFGILALSTRRHGAEREPQTILGQPNGFQGSSAVPKEEVDELCARAKE